MKTEEQPLNYRKLTNSIPQGTRVPWGMLLRSKEKDFRFTFRYIRLTKYAAAWNLPKPPQTYFSPLREKTLLFENHLARTSLRPALQTKQIQTGRQGTDTYCLPCAVGHHTTGSYRRAVQTAQSIANLIGQT